MKVLLVITKGELGGAQQFVLDLARGLKERGVGVEVGYGRGNYLPVELAEAGISTKRFRYLQRSRNPFLTILFAAELYFFLKKNAFDVVHFNSSNTLVGGMAAKRSCQSIRTVFTLHGLSMLDPGYRTWRLVKYMYRQYFRFFLQWVDLPVFVSRTNYDLARSIGLVKSGQVVHNGIDPARLDFLSSGDARQHLADRIGADIGNVFLIGSIGRLSYAKNYEFLIRVFPRLLKIYPQAHLIIIGEGEKRREYEAVIEQNNLAENVFLAGAIPEARRYLKAFDIFVLPSRYEGLSITLAETLFAGVPVLASNVGGNREILSEEMLYQFDNRTEFIDKFAWLMEVENREMVISTMKERAKQFDAYKTTDNYLRLYRELRK
jgi:glycosyltransferase involved in cell wall biosynthesis